MGRTRRRDRHGRGIRVFGAAVPARLSPAQSFARTAGRLFDDIRPLADGLLDDAILAVDAVPSGDRPRELGCVFPAHRGQPPVIVVYRLPIADRTRTREELSDLLGDVLAEQASLLTGIPPEDLRPPR